MTLSRHAKERWEERFPHLELFLEWDDAISRKMGKPLLNRIRRQFRLSKGYRYRVSSNNVVFVTDRGDHVVTVINLESNDTY